MQGEEPFIGSEALARGELSRHQLRTHYRAVLPNVYLPSDARASLRTRIVAAWLWSGRLAVIAERPLPLYTAPGGFLKTSQSSWSTPTTDRRLAC